MKESLTSTICHFQSIMTEAKPRDEQKAHEGEIYLDQGAQ